MVFQVHSRRKNTKGDWTLHASGALQAGEIAMPAAKFDAFQRDGFRKARYSLSRWSGVLPAPQGARQPMGTLFSRCQPSLAGPGRSVERGDGSGWH